MIKDNGGPAFSRPAVIPNHQTSLPEFYLPQSGMTLRDYFAAHAPTRTLKDLDLIDPTSIDILMREIAILRYQYADAMIAERKNES